MWKKILVWVVSNVLWPILKDISAWLIKELSRVIFDQVRLLQKKWQARDQDSAASDEDREKIRKNYEQRANDLDEVERNISERIPEIVKEAFDKYEQERDRLIEQAPEQQEKNQIEEKK